jgi:hypothetical protein
MILDKLRGYFLLSTNLSRSWSYRHGLPEMDQLIVVIIVGMLAAVLSTIWFAQGQ